MYISAGVNLIESTIEAPNSEEQEATFCPIGKHIHLRPTYTPQFTTNLTVLLSLNRHLYTNLTERLANSSVTSNVLLSTSMLLYNVVNFSIQTLLFACEEKCAIKIHRQPFVWSQ